MRRNEEESERMEIMESVCYLFDLVLGVQSLREMKRQSVRLTIQRKEGEAGIPCTNPD